MDRDLIKWSMVAALVWAAWRIARSKSSIAYTVGDIKQTFAVNPLTDSGDLGSYSAGGGAIGGPTVSTSLGGFKSTGFGSSATQPQ